jgi:hypothetical protein
MLENVDIAVIYSVVDGGGHTLCLTAADWRLMLKCSSHLQIMPHRAIRFMLTTIACLTASLAESIRGRRVILTEFQIPEGYIVTNSTALKTWGGEVQMYSGENSFATLVWDRDGDVYFELRPDFHSQNYCVIDSGINIITLGRTVSVVERNGLACVLEPVDFGFFRISAPISHVLDCSWYGEACEMVMHTTLHAIKTPNL